MWNPLEYFRDDFQTSYPPPRLYELFHYDYALMGAYPMRTYLPERATYSIDILIDPISKDEIVKALREVSHPEETYSDTHTFFTLRESRLHLTLLSLEPPWLLEALDAARKHLDTASTEPTLPFPWIILSKLDYGKRQDFMDCARLIARASQQQLDATKALLEKWNPSYIPELRQLYRVGTAEQQNAPQRAPAYRNEKTEYTSWHHMSAAHFDYLDIDWRDLIDQPGLDLITTPQEWPEEKVYYTEKDADHIAQLLRLQNTREHTA